MSTEDSNHPSIAIIGSGFSGLGVAIRLVQAGFTDLTVYERAGDIGGVWRDNTYPGAACDAPSHLYSYSFAPNPDWSRRFAPQPEILDYLRRCAEEFGIRKYVRTSAEVVAAVFDEHSYRWELELESGAKVYADGPGVLIVQNRRDPVTPLRGGELLDEKFGARSRLVTVDGSGHGAYVLGDNPCAIDVTTRYLVDGTMPGQDVACAAVPAGDR